MGKIKNNVTNAVFNIEGWEPEDLQTLTINNDEFVEIEVSSEKELAEMGKTYIKGQIKVAQNQVGKYKRLLSRQLANFQNPIAILGMYNGEEYLIHLSSALAIFLGESPLEVLKKKKEQLEKLSSKYNGLGEKIKKELSHADPRRILSSLKVGNKARLAEIYYKCAAYSDANVELVEEQISNFGGKIYSSK